MNRSALPGGTAESSSAGGGLASRLSLAADLVPVDEVQALLDDLAPACQVLPYGRGECSVPAVWIVVLACQCGTATRSIPMCGIHLARAMDGRNTHHAPAHALHGPQVVIRSERIRSKPTK